MTKRNRTRYALLGLLSWQELSGYEIKQLVEMGLSHFWQESYGQLYPTLARLVDDGLAMRRHAPGGLRRERHQYRVTKRGLEEFRRWLAEPTDPPRVKNEFLLKLFLCGREPLEQVVHLIREQRDREAAALREYRSSEKTLVEAIDEGETPSELAHVLGDVSSRQLQLFLLTLRQGIAVLEARLRWCEESLDYLGRESASEEGNRDSNTD